MTCLGIALCLAQAAPAAQEPAPPKKAAPAAVVEKLKGDADVKAPSAKDWQPAKEGMGLEEGAQVSTGFDTEMVLRFEGDHRVTLKALTQIEVTKLLRSEKAVETSIRLDIGSMKGKVEKESVPVRFEVTSPVVTASVKGTEWTFGYSSDFGFSARVVEGLLALEGAGAPKVDVPAGGAAATPPANALQPGGPLPRGLARGFEMRENGRAVALFDRASQADFRASAVGMPPQYAEFSLNDAGVSTSVMSLRSIVNGTGSFLVPAGGAVFALCPCR